MYIIVYGILLLILAVSFLPGRFFHDVYSRVIFCGTMQNLPLTLLFVK